MEAEACFEHPLFGGAISSAFPMRFQDISNVREVPDHQEVYADPSHDDSIFFELLDLKQDVSDGKSSAWLLWDLATEQDAEGSLVIEKIGTLQPTHLIVKDLPAEITTTVGRMVYRTMIRTTGFGTASSVARIGGILCLLVAVSLFHACYQTLSILLFKVVIFCSGVAALLLPHEIKGCALNDNI